MYPIGIRNIHAQPIVHELVGLLETGGPPFCVRHLGVPALSFLVTNVCGLAPV